MPDDPSDDSGDAPVEDLDDVPVGDAGEDGVLRPDDLDVDDREEVRAIGDDRYVVSTEEGRPPTPRDDPPTDVTSTPAADAAPDSASGTTWSPDASVPGADASASAEPRSLADALDGVEERYATALAVKTDRGVAAEEFASNNVVATFERTLRWYADRVDDSEPPEAVLRVLLAKSDLEL